jgi:hypothetical protein
VADGAIIGVGGIDRSIGLSKLKKCAQPLGRGTSSIVSRHSLRSSKEFLC